MLSLIDGNDFTCALRRGKVQITCRNGILGVLADRMDGELLLNGKNYPIRCGQKLEIPVSVGQTREQVQNLRSDFANLA